MANREAIRAWHDALLSGDYRQSTGALTNSEGECCLGVAALITPGITWKKLEDGGTLFENETRSFLPSKTVEWLGVDDRNPDLRLRWRLGTTEDAITLNDERRYTFVQIAECIRLTWPEFFEDFATATPTEGDSDVA